MKTKGLFPKIWKWTKRIFLFLFIAQFVYIILLKWVNPPVTITQLVSWVSGYGLKRDYVDKDEMSPEARLAVIASEDQKFADHDGFDWKSIEKAQKYNATHKKTRGASTISQQTAKNVFLWQGGGYFRKGLEVYFTFMIELIWGKERILEVYLNIAEMGKGVFGIEAASQAYYKKPAKSLSRGEAALIAACLPNPKVFKVDAPTSYVRFRARRIQQQMNNIAPIPVIKEVVQ